jgi:hypothetical protein
MDIRRDIEIFEYFVLTVRINRATLACIWLRGPWKNIDEVEYATQEWVDWYR